MNLFLDEFWFQLMFQLIVHLQLIVHPGFFEISSINYPTWRFFLGDFLCRWCEAAPDAPTNLARSGGSSGSIGLPGGPRAVEASRPSKSWELDMRFS